ncbi:hypothetical protein CSOJ01_15960 [Colletotrichum sojae]|uniref:Uncharacterized protein n=1 Tax=Colletotrichum sojae TaxID=2175907 RepID=A0A8H6MI26_9PEZI|nr:hypothetical protein CSOJ01_15960 [Colletotrichum sojae]
MVIALCPDITARLPKESSDDSSDDSSYDVEDDEGDDVGAAVRIQFAACRWRSRSWTWQEGVMAQLGWYMAAEELVPANTLEHWVNCSTAVDARLCNCPFCSRTAHRAGQHAGEVTTWKQTLWVNALNGGEQSMWGLLLGSHNWTLQEAMEAMEATCQRQATIPLDKLYSIMGAVKEVRGVKVDYQADLTDKLKEFVQAGDCASCLVTSRTINRKPRACWMPEVVDNPAWKEEVNWMMEDAAGNMTSDGLLLTVEDLGEVESTIETHAGLMVIGGGNTPWTIIADGDCAARPRNRAFMMRRERDGVVVFAENAGEELWHRLASADLGGQLEWLPTHPTIAVELG